VQVRFVVMQNLFCSELSIHRRYDLKGSTMGRSVGEEAAEVGAERRMLSICCLTCCVVVVLRIVVNSASYIRVNRVTVVDLPFRKLFQQGYKSRERQPRGRQWAVRMLLESGGRLPHRCVCWAPVGAADVIRCGCRMQPLLCTPCAHFYRPSRAAAFHWLAG
jgi:hypothetical protein